MSSEIPISASPATMLSPARTAGGKFLNPVPTTVARAAQLPRMIRRLMTERQRGEPGRPLGPFPANAGVFARPPAHGLRVTWMGHSSLLIEIGGARILTDPVWSERASFVSFAGPKRFFAPPLSLRDLPRLNAVLLSHDHYDHLDRATICRLAETGVRMICSLGMRRNLESWGAAAGQITELNWGGTAQIGKRCSITATPARHFSGRSLWGRNETLWSSFVIRSANHNIFFGADSGPFDGFASIGEAYGPFDLTMLEIGAYDADWPEIHMGPDHAAEAHVVLRGKLMLPIHWGTFNLAFHPWREPVERLLAAAEARNIRLLLPQPGSPVEVTGEALNSGWWNA